MESEIKRNMEISKIRYKIGQYFEITKKYHEAGRACFSFFAKEGRDHYCEMVTFNTKRVVPGIIKQEATVTA